MIYKNYSGSPNSFDSSSVEWRLSSKAEFYNWLERSASSFLSQTAQLTQSIAEFNSVTADPKNPLSGFWREFTTANDAYTLGKIRSTISMMHGAIQGSESDLVRMNNQGRYTPRLTEYVLARPAYIDQLQGCMEGENNLERLNAVLASMDPTSRRIFGDHYQLSPAERKLNHYYRHDEGFQKIANDTCGRFDVKAYDLIRLLKEKRLYVHWKNWGTSEDIDWSNPQSVNVIVDASYDALKSIPKFVSERGAQIHDPRNPNAQILQEIEVELPEYVEKLIPQLMSRYFPQVNINRLEQNYQTECHKEQAKREQEFLERKKRLPVRDPWQEKGCNWTGKHKGWLPQRSGLYL
jgi:hypothetical protein